MSRSRAALITGVLAGIAANYWALETLLADRSDPAGAWISDLGARTEGTGLLFDLLAVVSGLLIAAFAVLLLPLLGRRSRVLRFGVLALFAVGICAIVDGAFPLSCAESLAEPCELSYDVVDLIHGGETFLSIAITVLTFALFAAGLWREGNDRLRRLGAWTLVAGIVWTGCNALMGAQYLIDDLASAKGIFHRAAQVILGLWLIALALVNAGISAPPGSRDRASSPYPRASSMSAGRRA